MIFGEKKVNAHKMSFDLLYKLSEKFLILRIGKDILSSG
jgi:hypothetical protein